MAGLIYGCAYCGDVKYAATDVSLGELTKVAISDKQHDPQQFEVTATVIRATDEEGKVHLMFLIHGIDEDILSRDSDEIERRNAQESNKAIIRHIVSMLN